MKYELTQRFYFEAAHTLDRAIEAAPSRRIHGHTYVAEETVTAEPDPKSGMVVDLAHLRQCIESVQRVVPSAPPLLPTTLIFQNLALEAQHSDVS